MKIVKYILIVLTALLLIVSAVGLLFFPAKVEMGRSITVNASPGQAFGYLNSLKHFNEWSPWYEMDTTARYTCSGPESGPGSTISWESKNSNVGTGTMRIVQSEPDSLVGLDMDFGGNGKATARFLVQPVDSGTRVEWVFGFDAGANPLLRIMGAFMDKMVGSDYEKGLQRLKTVLENTPPLQVEIVTLPSVEYLSVRSTTELSNISATLGTSYAAIMQSMGKQKLNPSGAPFAIYHTAPPVFDVEAGIPVDRPGKEDGGVKAGKRMAGRACQVKFFGAYEKTAEAHAAIDRYIQQHGLKMAGSPLEVYVTDPGMQPDTSQWETDILYPIE